MTLAGSYTGTRFVVSKIQLTPSTALGNAPPWLPRTVGYGGYCIKAECDKYNGNTKVGTYTGLSNEYSIVGTTKSFCEVRRNHKGERCDEDVRVTLLPGYPPYKCVGLYFTFEGGNTARLM